MTATPSIFEQTDRREWLASTLAGLGLSISLPGLDARAAKQRGSQRPSSLITLWLAGAASQLETWDPHPGTAIGGPTQSIKTKLPGLEIAAGYPRTAEVIHELSVIRSLVSKEGDHERATYMVKTGYRPDQTLRHPSIGAILAKERWSQTLPIPQHVSLVSGAAPARGGFLGARYDAFKIYDPGRGVRNLDRRVDDVRQRRRLRGLDVVNRAFSRRRRVAADRTQHTLIVAQALAMMNAEQLQAFRLDAATSARSESAATLAAYGDTRFGRGCLVARRLVEAGVRAIEVTLNGWDTHANNFEGHQVQAEILDPALAALLADLKKRDLLDSTIVLVLGEFGRTPTINPLDGRDHWPSGFSCLVGGGGLAAGRVLGSTDPTARRRQPKDPVRIADLYATILRQMGIDHEKEVQTPIGRPMAYCEGTPVERLL